MIEIDGEGRSKDLENLISDAEIEFDCKLYLLGEVQRERIRALSPKAPWLRLGESVYTSTSTAITLQSHANMPA